MNFRKRETQTMIDFETPRFEADLKALKKLAETLEQASIWAYNAWTDAHNDLSRSAENALFLNLLGDVSKRVDALEEERKKLVAQLESKLKSKTPAKAVDSKPQGKAAVKTATPQAKQTVRLKTKTQLIAEAKQSTKQKQSKTVA